MPEPDNSLFGIHLYYYCATCRYIRRYDLRSWYTRRCYRMPFCRQNKRVSDGLAMASGATTDGLPYRAVAAHTRLALACKSVGFIWVFASWACPGVVGARRGLARTAHIPRVLGVLRERIVVIARCCSRLFLTVRIQVLRSQRTDLVSLGWGLLHLHLLGQRLFPHLGHWRTCSCSCLRQLCPLLCHGLCKTDVCKRA